ncbi:DUF4230 domain-containing protein [Pseudobutyrivibrio sp. MD2005]|uniref:DUF4230 domain-containing protein n=1 Tax=Pseudobutyrivibrio sp. MD2005 TaxID=1410616 RepID=UPI00048411DD|nr:DUF4230 domain-containing protein [Pseudobutyrivibrio sp. MD2005]
MQKKKIKLPKIPKSGKYIIPFIIISCIFVYVILLRLNADTMATTLGGQTGDKVGKLVGSFDALTDYQEAYAEGKEKGLSANDITVDIASEIKEVGDLDVMVATVKLKDVNKIGEGYAALYLLRGEVVFSVDLNKVKVDENESTITIKIPKPNMDFSINPSETEKIAEWQKKFFNGTTEAGYIDHINSMKSMYEKSPEEIVNYSSLVSSAEEAAKNQVGQLATSLITNKDKEVVVDFLEE